MASQSSARPSPADPASPALHSALHGVWTAAAAAPWIVVGLGVFLTVMVARMLHAAAYSGTDRDPVRRFSRSDKATVVARAGGRCEQYGWVAKRCQQTEHLEADHIHPYSRGGQTAVANGQALCREHTWARRARVPFGWQLRALERRRAEYFPVGVSGRVVRLAGRPTEVPRARAVRVPMRAV